VAAIDPTLVLDVVAEDPQVQHVAEEMQPATVHEHAGRDGMDLLGRISGEAAGHERPLI
jgi:hypothetical protein